MAKKAEQQGISRRGLLAAGIGASVLGTLAVADPLDLLHTKYHDPSNYRERPINWKQAEEVLDKRDLSILRDFQTFDLEKQAKIITTVEERVANELEIGSVYDKINRSVDIKVMTLDELVLLGKENEVAKTFAEEYDQLNKDGLAGAYKRGLEIAVLPPRSYAQELLLMLYVGHTPTSVEAHEKLHHVQHINSPSLEAQRILYQNGCIIKGKPLKITDEVVELFSEKVFKGRKVRKEQVAQYAINHISKDRKERALLRELNTQLLTPTLRENDFVFRHPHIKQHKTDPAYLGKAVSLLPTIYGLHLPKGPASSVDMRVAAFIGKHGDTLTELAHSTNLRSGRNKRELFYEGKKFLGRRSDDLDRVKDIARDVITEYRN